MPKNQKKIKFLKVYSSNYINSSNISALNYKQISMKLGIHNPSKRAEVLEFYILLISNQMKK